MTSSTSLDGLDFDSRHGGGGGGAPRWHIDASTLAILEHVFSIDQFPNVDVRKQLGADLGVSARQIQVWFQNRRQRERKRKEISSKKRPGGSSKGGGSSTASSLSSLSSATLCSSTEEISTALVDEFGGREDEEPDDDDDDDDDGFAKKPRGLPLAPMPKLPSASRQQSDEPPQSPHRSASSGDGEYDWREAMRSLLPHAMGRLPEARTTSMLGQGTILGGGGGGYSGGYSGGGYSGGGYGGGGHGGGMQTPIHEQLAAGLAMSRGATQQLGAELSLPTQQLGAELSCQSVATRLAAACQSSLLGRTLQQYGGVVQSITEGAPPYRILSVSSGWQKLCGYHREEVLGHPLKFLQGPRTQPAAITALMNGVRLEQPVAVRLTNYTKDGLPFTHQLSVEPLRDPSGITRCFQATSLVLQAPGEAHSEVEAAAVGQMPLLSTNPLPPLWPLLGRAVRPNSHEAHEAHDVLGLSRTASSTTTHASAPSRLRAEQPASRTDSATAAASVLDDDESFLAWLQAEGPGGTRLHANGDEGMAAIINGIADEMRMHG